MYQVEFGYLDGQKVASTQTTRRGAIRLLHAIRQGKIRLQEFL